MDHNHHTKLKTAALALAVAATSQVFTFPGVANASASSRTTSVTQAQQTATTNTTALNKGLATNNRIYRTGRLAQVNCNPGSLPTGSTSAYRRFLTRVTDCLNRAWATQFRKAGMPFSKPRLRIITRKVGNACGGWATGAAGFYCSGDRTMYMLITKRELRQPFPLGIARLMAHEYGHHVQNISKIWNYYAAANARAGKAQRLQLSRNSELQAECFSAVFMSTQRGGSLFTEQEWDGTVEWFRQNGAKAWPQNDHGRGPTQAAWMTRGYNSGSPGACNTWAASPRTTT
ncbi:Putative neutral zinc metallopeptidase [Nonomuraea coxensis DSM 45129]|uniref:Neutral zinc metallopeptidase n=1 Tax=Nonomuraea coxensis DSM 45129 TaxID=1122611 RepID=A0ABX8U3Z2_9ACTN|nr:neutral zinc metallopeptidase [Nonomuraea coxensis]QYC42161.1 Putative neutral zinc metallopeptidase [Nonomuraea coxensis DSM 45129]